MTTDHQGAVHEPTYWHGGRPGIQRGAFLLPPAITRVPSLSEFGASGVHRRDRVYVTTSQAAALLYAAASRGWIYRVLPVGDLEPDPDCTLPGLSFQCERARVLQIIKPRRSHIQVATAVLLGQTQEIE